MSLPTNHRIITIKLAIEALLCHVSKFSSSNSSSAKNSNNLISNSRVLLRLVRAGVICPGFTDKQKGTLLKTSVRRKRRRNGKGG